MLELDVNFAGFEQEAGDLAALVDDIVGRLANKVVASFTERPEWAPPPEITRAMP
ncbi:MAG TPA: hypothetical protein VKG22_09785 [Stellaceae bacterium]|nr:hypothetical protein [Stellaceae bacterium]